MILYDLMTESRISDVHKRGCIWCTDGSFVSPDKFSDSGKVAYGYALSNTTAVRITRSISSMPWASSVSDNPFNDTTGANSLTDGVSNSNILKSISGFNSSNCPAVYYACCSQVNAGVTSYMPSRDELKALYNSIMSGRMKDDLLTAGLYSSCNYREAISIGWGYIWSSTESIYFTAYYVDYQGNVRGYTKEDVNYVIPFFRI